MDPKVEEYINRKLALFSKLRKEETGQTTEFKVGDNTVKMAITNKYNNLYADMPVTSSVEIYLDNIPNWKDFKLQQIEYINMLQFAADTSVLGFELNPTKRDTIQVLRFPHKTYSILKFFRDDPKRIELLYSGPIIPLHR